MGAEQAEVRFRHFAEAVSITVRSTGTLTLIPRWVNECQEPTASGRPEQLGSST
jgi:hypothetical protein